MTLKIKTIFWIAVFLIAIFTMNVCFFNGQLNQFGIKPRTMSGLVGIFSSPGLHGNLNHLLNNLVGLGIFSFLTLLHGARYFWRASFFIIVMGGLGVWLTGRDSIHIGASGWIFGLWALSIANGWYQRSLKTIAIAVLVIAAWGTMVLGLLPKSPYISFEAHICGALAGILFAALGKRRRAKNT